MPKQTTTTTSRRQFLSLAGACATTLAMPRIARAQAGETVTLLHGAGSVLLGWTPSFLAQEMGYYREEGIIPNRIMNGSGPAGLTALISGSGAALITAPGEMLIAAARGQDMRILFAESNYQAVHFVVSESYAAQHGVSSEMPYEQRREIATGFNGIRIGISTPGSLTDLAARATLRNIGLEPNVSAQIVPLQSVANAMAAMGSGNIDAFVGASPAPEIAEGQLGAVVLFSVGQDEIPGLLAMAGPVMEARGRDVDNNPDLYAALVRSDTRALRMILEEPAEAGERMYRAQFSNLDRAVWDHVWERNLSQFRTPYVSPESLAAWVTAGIVPGLTDPSSINYDDVIDRTFVDAAVEELGWQVPS